MSLKSSPVVNSIPLDLIQAQRAKRKLREFVAAAWHTVHAPSVPFIATWHVDAICEHLQAITEGQINRLLVNIPPSFMKSLLTSVFWPAWEWTRTPESTWVTASYADIIATRDALKTRDVIRSEWYQRHFGASFEIRSDQDAKTHFANTKRGYRIATTVGGTGAGLRAGRFVIDDPHNTTQVLSDLERQRPVTWFDQTVTLRQDDFAKSAIVCIMQRLHEKDLSGHILELGGYVHLCLPMEYEPKRRCVTVLRLPEKHPLRDPTTGTFGDPRKEEGDLLAPQRVSAEQLPALKKTLGSYGAAGQLQQTPAPLEGGLIKMKWFRERWKALPKEFRRLVLSIDTANKVAELNDFSAIGAWMQTDIRHYFADLVHDKLEFPELLKRVKTYVAACPKNFGRLPDAILIEDKASGTQLIQTLRSTTSWPIIPIQPEGDKVMRLVTQTPKMESGVVILPDPDLQLPWLDVVENEWKLFPNAAHDDTVDQATQYLKWTDEQPDDIALGMHRVKGMR